MQLDIDEMKLDLCQSNESDDKSPLPPGADDEEHPFEGENDSTTRVIGAYEVLGDIGFGGMGLVYKVRHRGAGKVLAMKVLRPELAADPINVKRFQQELKTTSLLTHPNVVPIYDSGVGDDGAPYFVMEYLDGRNLEEILADDGYIDPDRFVQLFTQVLDALIQAHEKKIVHRDLKPSNIVVCTDDSGSELVKILDFGIARVLQKASKEATRLTQLGEIVGSPAYMSPEQCLSQKLDVRSDIYSLAVVMYQCLAGVTPFSGEGAVEIIMGHLNGRPRAISKLRPDFAIPPDLEAMIMTCLEKDPAERFQSAEELKRELERISLSMHTESMIGRWRQFCRRRRNKLRRNLRAIAETRRHWLKAFAAATALTGLITIAYIKYAPRPDVSAYMDQAQLALAHNDYDQVYRHWSKAIALAKREHRPNQELAKLLEGAGDDMISNISYQLGLAQEYTQLQALRDSISRSGQPYAKGAETAERLYHEALNLYDHSNQTDRIRVFGKLAAIAKELEDDSSEAAYLTEITSVPKDGSIPQRRPGVYKALAEIREHQGRYKEAEELWKRAWKAKQVYENDANNYVQARGDLEHFYERTGRYKSAETMLRDDVAYLRLRQMSGDRNASYCLPEALSRLATCLKNQGRTAEAIVVANDVAKEKKEQQ